MKESLGRAAIVALATALGTALLGWWTVPLVGAGWALLPMVRRPVTEAALGAGLGWAGLLALTAMQGDMGRAAERVGGVLNLPGAGLVAVTIVFASLLAGSAAVVVGGMRQQGGRGVGR